VQAPQHFDGFGQPVGKKDFKPADLQSHWLLDRIGQLVPSNFELLLKIQGENINFETCSKEQPAQYGQKICIF
jgi:hypothetical protein